jgi:ATP-dependent Clp protease protease subunit
MAGTTVLMAPTSCIMIHDPMTIAVGNSGEMQKAIEMLNTVKDSSLMAYELKTGLDRETLSKMMTEETWMSAAKAVELGFADGILERTEQSVSDRAVPILFSQRTVDTALVNRLAERKDNGVPVAPLYQRLEQLKIT